MNNATHASTWRRTRLGCLSYVYDISAMLGCPVICKSSVWMYKPMVENLVNTSRYDTSPSPWVRVKSRNFSTKLQGCKTCQSKGYLTTKDFIHFFSRTYKIWPRMFLIQHTHFRTFLGKSQLQRSYKQGGGGVLQVMHATGTTDQRQCSRSMRKPRKKAYKEKIDEFFKDDKDLVTNFSGLSNTLNFRNIKDTNVQTHTWFYQKSLKKTSAFTISKYNFAHTHR